ncbi:hypothetical protein OAC86_01285 [bacterium]|nr:hypothetical protein [bacterium]
MGKLRIKQIHEFATEVASAINADLAGAGVTAAVSVETSRALEAEGVNAGLVSTEKSRALLAEGVNAGLVSTEKSRALLAEGVLSDAIDGLGDEYATDVELSNAVSTETSRATAAEGTLSGRIDANEEFIANIDDTYATDAQLSSAVSVEKARALKAEGDLSDAIDGLDGVYATDVELSNAVSTEKSRAIAAEGLIDGRVTTLLGGATEALDTFGEINNFIKDLSTEDINTIAAISTAVSNDVIHAGLIGDNATAISTEKSRALLAEGVLSDAIDGLGDEYATDVELSNAVSVEKSRATAAEGTLSGRIDTNEEFIANIDDTYATDAQLSSAVSVEKSRATGAEDDLAAAIAALESDIDGFGFDSAEVVGSNVVAGGFQSKTATFQVAANDELDVFVNGLQVHRAAWADEALKAAAEGWVSVDGINFTVQNLGYALEESDHIIISGKVA